MSLFTDFENFSVLKPHSRQEAAANTMFDQVDRLERRFKKHCVSTPLSLMSLFGLDMKVHPSLVANAPLYLAFLYLLPDDRVCKIFCVNFKTY